MSKIYDFSDDFWKQFRTPEEKHQDGHCLNCGVELFDDDLDEPYERGYCRGCQLQDIGKRTVEKLDASIEALNNIEAFTKMFRSRG